MEERGKIEFHYGFFGAIRLRSDVVHADLTFLQEYEIGEQPIRMDMVIIKNEDAGLEDEILRFFRKYNIIEYKSPDDGLDIHDFYKAQGYACIYQHPRRIPMGDIAVSLFRHVPPRKMFLDLEEYGCEVKEVYPGIYHVRGPVCAAAQVVVTSQLPEGKYEEFKVLTRGARREDVVKFLRTADENPESIEHISAILRVSIAANEELFQQIKEEGFMMGAVERLFHDEFEKGRSLAWDEGRNAGILLGRNEGIQLGRNEERKIITDRLIAAGWTPQEAARLTGLSGR